MGLSIGIIGLPNVGKSTVFNALIGVQQAMVANYPFCTIQPNRAIVPLPDKRLDHLGSLLGVPEIIHATVEFVDIAGLVRGASHGEGLGNQFLAQIRDVAAILHVVRCFEDPNVVHVSASPDPATDIEIVNLELILADLQQLDRKIERLASAVKADKKLQTVLDFVHQLRRHLQVGLPASSFFEPDVEIFQSLNREMKFLSAKPVIFLANLDESSLGQGNVYFRQIQEIANKSGVEIIGLCAYLEQEMLAMAPEERAEYLQLSGIEESGLEQVIRKSFNMLRLISFFTRNQQEVRAWNVPQGTLAPQAAGVIHTDFERGFIRAEVIPYEVFVQSGSTTAVKAAGQMQLEGKEYVVQDGDIIQFRFNV